MPPSARALLHPHQRLTGLNGVGDTGGIVEEDWSTINWGKIDYLQSVGLQPWYRSKSATPAAPAAGTR